MNRLVVGTVNRTDRLLGSMVKHGENSIDLLPLGDLYQTEVEKLASGLEVPEGILERPQQTIQSDESAAERLGVEPRTLDSLLCFAVDEEHNDVTVADHLDVDREVVRRIIQRVTDTRHKRHRPPTPSMVV